MKAMGMTFGMTKSEYFTFFSPMKRYEVTLFQRPYTWDEYQIRGVIADFEYILSTGHSVSWANVLLQKQPQSVEHPDVMTYDIGDGQQRIISMNLALLAVWHFGNQLRDGASLEETAFLDELIPRASGPGEVAHGHIAHTMPGSNVYVRTRTVPSVSFRSEPLQLAWMKLFSQMSESLVQELEGAVAKQDGLDPKDRLFRNFHLYMTYLQERGYTLARLETLTRVILEKFCLTVHEYESDENMQRAFANMNSFGVKLLDGELVKSEIYGEVKARDAQLADEIAQHWTKSLETAFWHRPLSKANPTMVLDYCLRQSLLSHSDFRMDSNELLRDKDRWGTFVKRHPDHGTMWEDLRTDLNLYEIAMGIPRPSPGSWQWETAYAFQVIANVMRDSQILAYMMKARRVMDDDDFAMTMRVLTKYCIYRSLIPSSGGNWSIGELLNQKRSPFMRDSFTSQDVREYLESVTSRWAQWMDLDRVRKVLAEKPFTVGYNAVLCELFVYVSNEIKRKNDDLDSMHISTGLFNENSREHILPRKPRDADMTEEEKMAYDYAISLLGNTIPLGLRSNIKSSNRDVSEKVVEYRNFDDNTGWGRWVREFLRTFEAGDSTWTPREIRQRTQSLADLIAPHLVSESPNVVNLDSVFHKMLQRFHPGQVFHATDDRGGEVPFTLLPSGALEMNSGRIITTMVELMAIVGAKSRSHHLRMMRVRDAATGKMVEAKNFPLLPTA